MAVVSGSLPIRDLVAFIRDISDATTKGTAKGILEAVEIGYADAMRRAKTQFNNTPGRARSGMLMNGIYRGYDKSKLEGFVGQNGPYGAMMEFGGTVVPVNAKHLWVKNYRAPAQFKRMTPKEFMTARSSDPQHYRIFKNPHTDRLIAAYQAGGKGPGQTTALFTLMDKVHITGRPYIEPAVKAAYERLAELIAKHTEKEFKS